MILDDVIEQDCKIFRNNIFTSFDPVLKWHKWFVFLSDPGVPGVRSMGPDLSKWLTTRLFADLNDVTLADDDSNSIPIDDVNKAILGNVAMQVAPSGGQHWN